MARNLRYLPPDRHLVEVTCRIIQRRFLLRPSPKLNAIILGTLARAQERYAMTICGFVYLSNHCHLLLVPESVEQLAAFMRYLNSKIAREAGRLHGWTEKLWGRRYTSIVVSHEPEAQIQRLRYLLDQGCKERLVTSPRHWPGATSTRALLKGEPLEGLWIDRTAQYEAHERGEANPDERFATTYRLELSPIPCWEDFADHQYQARLRTMVHEIERKMEGVEVLGKQAICRQDPHAGPTSSPPRSPAPRFHAVQPQVRRALEWVYHLVQIAYRQAYEALCTQRAADFPPGTFVPGRFLPLTRSGPSYFPQKNSPL
jgi:REP element-mobilizing transposase RayT